MRRALFSPQALALAVLFLPLAAYAQDFTPAVSLFNIFVGLMLTAAILTYAAGLISWSTLLSTWPTNRTEAIKVMEWSVVILFVLVLILGVVQFFRDHPQGATYVVAAIILVFIAWAIVAIVRASGKKEEE